MADKLFEYPCKVDASAFQWIGDPDAITKDSTPQDRLMAEARDRLVVWGGADDPDADYSFDETALVSLGEFFYVVQTAGCSCPSRGEMWSVEVSGPLPVIEKWFNDGNYKGYTLPDWAKASFEAALALARGMT